MTKDGDISLGFDGFTWHTHADILAELSGMSEDVALRNYVDALLNDQAIIAIARVGGKIQDVWIADGGAPINTSQRMRPMSFAIGVARRPSNQAMELTASRCFTQLYMTSIRQSGATRASARGS